METIMDPISYYVDQLSTLDFADLCLVLGKSDESDVALARLRRGRAEVSLHQASIDPYDDTARPKLVAAAETRDHLSSTGQWRSLRRESTSSMQL
jgi:hypothetical protein